MIKIIKSLLIFSFIVLTACQQTPKVKTIDESKAISEVNEVLTVITIEAIKEQNYEQAQRSINALILSNDDKVWEFIFSAIITLPKEIGLQIIEFALSKDYVKNSSTQLYGIAKIYISHKNTEEALKTINKSIALDAENLDSIFWRARLLTVIKEYEKAEVDFKYILKKQPNHKEYTDQYASFLQETKQFIKAQDVLAKQEKSIENLFRRIIFTLQAKDTDTANALYLELKNIEVEKDKNNRKHFLIAESAYFLEHYEDSETYYKKVLGGSEYLEAREMLSLLLFENKKYDEAIEILHQLQNAEEKYAVKAYLIESQINKEQGNPESALQTLTRSLQIIPNNPILLYERAMLNESLDNMNQVEKDLLQIIKDDPNNYEAFNALGYSLADHDLKLEKAHEYIQKAISMAPDNAAIIDSLGWVQYKLGLYEAAEANFKKALITDIKDPELYIHLYKTLLKLEKNEEAKKLIEKAADIFPKHNRILELNQGN